jgi:hypothetical protein
MNSTYTREKFWATVFHSVWWNWLWKSRSCCPLSSSEDAKNVATSYMEQLRRPVSSRPFGWCSSWWYQPALGWSCKVGVPERLHQLRQKGVPFPDAWVGGALKTGLFDCLGAVLQQSSLPVQFWHFQSCRHMEVMADNSSEKDLSRPPSFTSGGWKQVYTSSRPKVSGASVHQQVWEIWRDHAVVQVLWWPRWLQLLSEEYFTV